MRNLIIIQCIVFALSSCAKSYPQQLSFRVEDRNIADDSITEYRFFENGLVNRTQTYSAKELFSSKFIELDKKQTEQVKAILVALQKLDYINDFPWKEDYYKRGNVMKIEFPDEVELKFFANKPSKTINIPQTFYFYTGHEKQPQVFVELQQLINHL